MSTVNNISPNYRRQSIVSNVSALSSPEASPYPSPRKVITSKPSKPTFRGYDERTRLPRRKKSTRTTYNKSFVFLYDCFALLLRIPRNIVYALGIILIALYLLSDNESPGFEGPSTTPGTRQSTYEFPPGTPSDTGTLLYFDELKDRAEIDIPNWEPSDIILRSPEITTVDLTLPLNRFKDLEVAHYLDSLQAAYADIRFTINELRNSVPDMSLDVPRLSRELRKFRESTGKFSEAIGAYRKSIYRSLRNLSSKNAKLQRGLRKVKPEGKWGDEIDRNSAEGKKMAQIWLDYFDNMKKEVQNIDVKTSQFKDEVSEFWDEKKNLMDMISEAQVRMTKESRKRGLDNFEFDDAKRLFARINELNGYEAVLTDTIKRIQKPLSITDSRLREVKNKLQKLLSPASKDDSAADTLPTINEQMEELDWEIGNFDDAIASLDSKEANLVKRLKGKAHASKEKIEAYEDVIRGQNSQDHGRRKRQKESHY